MARTTLAIARGLATRHRHRAEGYEADRADAILKAEHAQAVDKPHHAAHYRDRAARAANDRDQERHKADKYAAIVAKLEAAQGIALAPEQEPAATAAPVDLTGPDYTPAAAGTAEQWATTHAALTAHIEELHRARASFDAPATIGDDIARADRLNAEVFEAVYRADRCGRLTIELFPAEAQTLRDAKACREAPKPATYTLQSPHYGGTPHTFTADQLAAAVPSYIWPGGYAAEYTTPDGSALCGECVRKAFTDPADADHDNAAAGSIAGPHEAHPSQHTTGLQCEGCNEWIVTPNCAECAKELTRTDPTTPYPWFDEAYGDETRSLLICARCLAQLVTKGDAAKAGKRTYSATGSHWYAPATFTR